MINQLKDKELRVENGVVLFNVMLCAVRRRSMDVVAIVCAWNAHPSL
jgi:hypothetical protein